MRFLEGSSPPHGLVYVNLPLATSTSVTYTKPATLLDSSSACVFPWLTANTEFSSAMLGATVVTLRGSLLETWPSGGADAKACVWSAREGRCRS